MIRDYGADAVLVEHPQPLQLWQSVHDREGVTEAVPGAETVLVRGPRARAAVADALATPLPSYAGSTDLVEIPVHYDGADLEGFDGLNPDEVVALHTGASYEVAFLGFAPGFPYLTGLPAQLHAPRLATPRAQVPAGSVAVAGPWCGIYPRASPGGWRLLGRTDLVLFDVRRTPPALLSPGARVRFVAL